MTFLSLDWFHGWCSHRILWLQVELEVVTLMTNLTSCPGLQEWPLGQWSFTFHDSLKFQIWGFFIFLYFFYSYSNSPLVIIIIVIVFYIALFLLRSKRFTVYYYPGHRIQNQFYTQSALSPLPGGAFRIINCRGEGGMVNVMVHVNMSSKFTMTFLWTLLLYRLQKEHKFVLSARRALHSAFYQPVGPYLIN